MKLTKLATAFAVALTIPLTVQFAAQAQFSPEGGATPQEAAKVRLEKANVRLDIARKQVEAAKARLKAAEAEQKAAKAHHEATKLSFKAEELSDASGLPAITETMIDSGRRNQLASKAAREAAMESESLTGSTEQNGLDRINAQPDANGNQYDFNSQPHQQQVPYTSPDGLSDPAMGPGGVNRNHQSNNNGAGLNLRPTLTASAGSSQQSASSLQAPTFVP